MPLHKAAMNGHATVVEQLLAAGADREAKDEVSGERGTRDADRAGSRGDTRRGGPFFFLVAVCALGFLCLVKSCIW